MKNTFKVIACITFFVGLCSHSTAQMTPLMKNSLRFVQAPFGLVEKAELQPLELPTLEGNASSSEIIQKVDGLFADSAAAMAWLVWRDGKLLYERYGAPELRTSLITSFSVSKTYTALMVGRALCDGQIKSLDDLASNYDPRLLGTAYEKNTLRSLLTMTTGVEHFPAQGGADLNSLWQGHKTTIETIQEKKKLPSQESYFEKRFNYDNAATNVLGLVVRSATGQTLSDYFSNKFYKDARPITSGRWLRDKAGEEFSMGSFLAIPRDHLRLGIHFMRLARGETGDTCMQSFTKQLVKKAVSTPTKPPLYGTDSGYGYQVWTNLSDLKEDVVEMRGNAGQHSFLSPTTNTVIVILTAADHRSDEKSILNAKNAVKLFLGR